MGGPQPGDFTVGAAGGYGAIHCFALKPWSADARGEIVSSTAWRSRGDVPA